MARLRFPLQWDKAWRPAHVDALAGTLIDAIVGAPVDVARAAAARGITAVDPAAPPEGVRIVRGVWPQVRGENSEGNVESGPTGTPWVDSNHWRVRLERALNPGASVWIDASRPPALARRDAEVRAFCDAASAGGRWIIRAADIELIPRLKPAMEFFAARESWADGEPQAVLGIASSFTAAFPRELVNLCARQHLAFRLIPAARLTLESLAGLDAIVWPDAAPLPETIVRFADQGGLVITSPRPIPGAGDSAITPRFAIHSTGKGRLAIAKAPLIDPYTTAADTALLLGRRRDIVRAWNAGAMVSYFTAQSGRGVVQLVNYATHPARYPLSIHIAGSWREAKLNAIGAEPQPIPSTRSATGLEIHVPEFAVYTAVELG